MERGAAMERGEYLILRAHLCSLFVVCGAAIAPNLSERPVKITFKL